MFPTANISKRSLRRCDVPSNWHVPIWRLQFAPAPRAILSYMLAATSSTKAELASAGANLPYFCAKKYF